MAMRFFASNVKSYSPTRIGRCMGATLPHFSPHCNSVEPFFPTVSHVTPPCRAGTSPAGAGGGASHWCGQSGGRCGRRGGEPDAPLRGGQKKSRESTPAAAGARLRGPAWGCLLYTSDAADDLLCVDLGGRRIIKKKN